MFSALVEMAIAAFCAVAIGTRITAEVDLHLRAAYALRVTTVRALLASAGFGAAAGAAVIALLPRASTLLEYLGFSAGGALLVASGQVAYCIVRVARSDLAKWKAALAQASVRVGTSTNR